MKKNIFMILSLSILCLMTSCGGGDIKPADPPITYDAYKSNSYYKYEDMPVKGCFEIEKVGATLIPDEDYSNIYSDIQATVKVKVLKTPDPSKERTTSTLGIQLLDKDEAVLATITWRIEGRSDLFNSQQGDIIILTGHTDGMPNDKAEEMLKKIKYIRLAGVAMGREIK
ncbi:MAG: hypothetical protein J1E97_01050 [Muribaculaceae bacterium]|nr:hypothetical protein [Muribaculaceae bacterium]